MIELLPTKAAFRAGDVVEVEVRGAAAAVAVTCRHLAAKVAEVTVDPDDPFARFSGLAAGGYGIEAGPAATAVDVQARPLERLRYGFVSDYPAGRDWSGVVDNVRRLHLNAVQFYDWMYRHAELLPGSDEFDDALGRRVSLDAVRRLAAELRGAGSLPMGYAAVYAVGEEHRDEWSAEALVRADGSPWMLADFLWIVDPSSERWVEHLGTQLAAARDAVGFAGFHLDQYGAPKLAARLDGTVVDLSTALPALIERVRRELPDATLIFNNVNDFPTWATAPTSQNAVYIEVWPPHEQLDHLGDLAVKARALAPGKPVSLAAYLSAYATDDEHARTAMCLELATVFSHGATCLLHGEEDAILVDPYYVRHKRLDAESVEAARRLYDFAVRYEELLLDTVEVTRTHLGGVNQELRVDGPHPVATDCRPGTIWTRAFTAGRRTVVSLIDLTGQEDVIWDAPKAPAGSIDGVAVAFERAGENPPNVFAAGPTAPRALELDAAFDGTHDVVSVPSWSSWTLVWTEPSTNVQG